MSYLYYTSRNINMNNSPNSNPNFNHQSQFTQGQTSNTNAAFLNLPPTNPSTPMNQLPTHTGSFINTNNQYIQQQQQIPLHHLQVQYSGNSNPSPQQVQHMQPQQQQVPQLLLPQLPINTIQQLQYSQQQPSNISFRQQQQLQQIQHQHQYISNHSGSFSSSNDENVIVKPLRKRAFSKRSKTGCLTCRERRIKCDETRPICKNCDKSKRSCNFPQVEHIKPKKTYTKKAKSTTKPKSRSKKSVDLGNISSSSSSSPESKQLQHSHHHHHYQYQNSRSPNEYPLQDVQYTPVRLTAYQPIHHQQQQQIPQPPGNTLDRRYIMPLVNNANNNNIVLPPQQQPPQQNLPRNLNPVYTYDMNMNPNGMINRNNSLVPSNYNYRNDSEHAGSISSIGTSTGNNSTSGTTSSSLLTSDQPQTQIPYPHNKFNMKFRNSSVPMYNININSSPQTSFASLNNNNNNNNNSNC